MNILRTLCLLIKAKPLFLPFPALAFRQSVFKYKSPLAEEGLLLLGLADLDRNAVCYHNFACGFISGFHSALHGIIETVTRVSA